MSELHPQTKQSERGPRLLFLIFKIRTSALVKRLRLQCRRDLFDWHGRLACLDRKSRRPRLRRSNRSSITPRHRMAGLAMAALPFSTGPLHLRRVPASISGGETPLRRWFYCGAFRTATRCLLHGHMRMMLCPRAPALRGTI